MNMLRTALLMAFLTGLFVAIGYLIGGQTGMVIAFLFAAGTNLFAYWNSDKMVLRMYRAREVDEQSAPEFVHLIRRAVRERRPPDAQGLYRREPAAERIRHRPRSASTRRSAPPPGCSNG